MTQPSRFGALATASSNSPDNLTDRRRVLGLGVWSALRGTGLPSTGISCSALAGSRAVDAGEAATPARLVVVMLRGAVDGLSVVAPWGDPAYYQARPRIAIERPGEADGLLVLDPLFGLHPALAPLMPHWQTRKLGFVHASGSSDATRSHFDAQDYMESGTPGRKSTADGWLNRLATVLALQQSAASLETLRLQAVNLGPVLPRIFSGAAPVASLGQGNNAVARGALEREQVARAFDRLYDGADALSQTYREATRTRREIMAALLSDDPGADGAALPLSGLAQDTARLGQLIRRDPRVRLAFVPVGGWDTHVNQGAGKGALATRLSLLAEALNALVSGCGDRFTDTTVLVMSEFGRTVAQNGNNGTDHGHGNVMWALGAGVAGGKVHGRWPGLAPAVLHEGRDLAVTSDFRTVIAGLLTRRFGLSPDQLGRVFPDLPPAPDPGLMA